MAVGSVSFGNAQAFADLVNKQQSYTTKNPSAATNISGEKRSHKGAKIGVGVAAAVIAAAVGLAIGAKKGAFNFETLKANEKVKALYEKFNKPEKVKDFGKTALAKMEVAGNAIAKFGEDAIAKVGTLVKKAE